MFYSKEPTHPINVSCSVSGQTFQVARQLPNREPANALKQGADKLANEL